MNTTFWKSDFEVRVLKSFDGHLCDFVVQLLCAATAKGWSVALFYNHCAQDEFLVIGPVFCVGFQLCPRMAQPTF
jgi:hypothetical protein